MSKKIFLDDPGQYLDEKGKRGLDNVKKNYIDDDLDYFGLIVADKTGVGLGKSTLAQIFCAYMDIQNWGIKSRRFHTGRIFFNENCFRLEEPYLKPMDTFEFDEPDAFWSLGATSKEQRRLKLKVVHLRQQRYFFMLCADSPFSVSKWVRPGGETRINAIFRITKKGVCLLYSMRTGTMQKIKMDTRQRKIIWPAADVIFFFKKIPKKTAWWKDYIKRKNRYLKRSGGNPKAVKLMQKEEKRMMNTLTLADVADIHKVSKTTVDRWVKAGHFGKIGVFKGFDGRIRIKMKAYRAGIKRVLKAKKKGLARRGKRGRDKKKRKVVKRGKDKVKGKIKRRKR